MKASGRLIWSATLIALGIAIIYFINSLTWLFPSNIIAIFNYLAILFFVLSILVSW
jgi:hypothetical protein